jgi:hypothetical protein
MGVRTGNAVRPEPVEGLSFSFAAEGEGEGFDKLSPNGDRAVAEA